MCFTNERMFIIAIHISPLEIIASIFHKQTVLHTANIVWLSRVPVCVVEGVGIASVRPDKVSLGTFITATSVPAIVPSCSVAWIEKNEIMNYHYRLFSGIIVLSVLFL